MQKLAPLTKILNRSYAAIELPDIRPLLLALRMELRRKFVVDDFFGSDRSSAESKNSGEGLLAF